MIYDEKSLIPLKRRALKLVLTLLSLVLIAIFIKLATHISEIFICFAIAILINYLLSYPVMYLTKYIRYRIISVVIIYLTFLSAVSMLFYYLIPVIGQQLVALKNAMPELVSNIDSFLVSINQFLLSHYQLQIPLDWVNKTELVNQLVTLVPKIDYAGFGNIATVILSNSLFAIVYSVLTIILSFYLLVDGERAWELFLIPFSSKQQFHLQSIKTKVDSCLYALIIGQLEIASLTALVMLITYIVLKVPYALLLGLAQMLEIIPVVGTWTAIIPCIIIVSFTTSISKGLFAFIVYLIYTQFFRDHFVTPRIMGSNLGYHPLAIIFAMVLGAQFAGVAGVILALPILAVVLSVINYNVELRRLKVSMRRSS